MTNVAKSIETASFSGLAAMCQDATVLDSKRLQHLNLFTVLNTAFAGELLDPEILNPESYSCMHRSSFRPYFVSPQILAGKYTEARRMLFGNTGPNQHFEDSSEGFLGRYNLEEGLCSVLKQGLHKGRTNMAPNPLA